MPPSKIRSSFSVKKELGNGSITAIQPSRSCPKDMPTGVWSLGTTPNQCCKHSIEKACASTRLLTLRRKARSLPSINAPEPRIYDDGLNWVGFKHLNERIVSKAGR